MLAAGATADRFVAEARAGAAVEHDHIVAVHAVEVHGGVHCITMPLLHGESLEQRLRDSAGPMPEADVVRLGREVADGLAAAHARGLIHRDIKPGNLWLERPHGRVKILDFGLALTAGTPGYMAPEQAQGSVGDARADLFGLGCVLYRAATGVAPFEADTPIGTIVRTLGDRARPAAEVNPKLDPRLAGLIDRLLAKEPNDRPETAAAVRDELAALAAARRWRSIRRWIAVAVLVAAAVVFWISIRR